MWSLVLFSCLLIGRQAVIGTEDTGYTAQPGAAGSVRHCLSGDGNTASLGDEAEKHCPSVSDPWDLLPRQSRRRRLGHCINATFIGEMSGHTGKRTSPRTRCETLATTSLAGATAGALDEAVACAGALGREFPVRTASSHSRHRGSASTGVGGVSAPSQTFISFQPRLGPSQAPALRAPALARTRTAVRVCVGLARARGHGGGWGCIGQN